MIAFLYLYRKFVIDLKWFYRLNFQSAETNQKTLEGKYKYKQDVFVHSFTNFQNLDNIKDSREGLS